MITKSIDLYPNIKAQSSDKSQPLENFESNTGVFDDILQSKQASKIDLLFTRERRKNIDNYYISQSYFNLPRNTIRKNSNIIILIKETLSDIILLFHDIAGLHMNLQEWKVSQGLGKRL